MVEREDQELTAIRSILKALEGMDGDSMQRVFDYVFNRLSIGRAAAASTIMSMESTAPTPSRQMSIKDLKEEKQPVSSNQMVAIVAYYLQESAPDFERKATIATADVEKYFKQARFKLPKVVSMALPNAAAAGYVDAIGSGEYRLNPVGYNLVVHGLPRSAAKVGPQRRQSGSKRARRA